MSSLLNARKRADEFDALVSGARPLDGSRPELLDLAELVAALRRHEPVAPAPEFSADLRSRLMAEARTVLTGEARSLALPQRQRSSRERRWVAAATAVVFVGGTAGMAAAAQSALPGDALYPLKRGIERAQASLNTDDAGKGRDLLSQASDRLSEARSLLDEGGSATPQVPGAIDDFTVQAQQGSALLLDSFADDRDPDAVRAVRDFAADSLPVLQELAKTAPPSAQEQLTEAALTLHELDQQALQACATCATDLPALRVPELFPAAADAKAALSKASRQQPDNSHPPLGSGAAPGSGTTGGTGTQGGSGTGAPGGTGTKAGPLAGTGGAQKAKDVEDTVRQTGEQIDELVGDLLDPLDDPLPTPPGGVLP